MVAGQDADPQAPDSVNTVDADAAGDSSSTAQAPADSLSVSVSRAFQILDEFQALSDSILALEDSTMNARSINPMAIIVGLFVGLSIGGVNTTTILAGMGVKPAPGPERLRPDNGRQLTPDLQQQPNARRSAVRAGGGFVCRRPVTSEPGRSPR